MQTQKADRSSVISTFRYLYNKGVLEYYLQLFSFALIMAIFGGATIWSLSLLPWLTESDITTTNTKNYFSHRTVTLVFCLAIVSFGPVYISFYISIIGLKSVIWSQKLPLVQLPNVEMRSEEDTKQQKVKPEVERGLNHYIYFAVFHVLFWPAAYLIVQFMFNFDFWFYYLDLVYFAISFLPLSVQAAYYVLSEEIVGDNCVLRVKFSFAYAIAELLVVISALGYTLFLFPIYANLDNTAKILWRLFLHPVWFEVFMILPQRLLAKKEIKTKKVYWRFLVVLHSLSHSVTIGRMLIMNISNTEASVILIVLTNLQEFIMRITTFERDYLMMWLISGKEKAKACYKSEELSIVHSCIVNAEMVFELAGIMISPCFMIFFAKDKYLFNFNSYEMSYMYFIYNLLIQLACEIVTDMICIIYEVRYSKLPLIEVWKHIRHHKVILFSIYALSTMGVLGMIYTSLRLPRVLFCTSTQYSSCSY